jgi:hypothetical protein
MDKGSVPPGEFATARLNTVQRNLEKIVENNAVTPEMAIAITQVQAQLGIAAALLDLAAAIRQTKAERPGPSE